MDSFLATWIVPLTFLPGVAGLILSTSNRYFHVNNLIREAIKKEEQQDKTYVSKLLKRSEFFHRALTFLYLSIGCFSVSALIGNLTQSWLLDISSLSYAADFLIVSGVVCVVFSAYQLISESIYSFNMIRQLAGKH